MPLYQAGNGKFQPIADFQPDVDPTTPGIILDEWNAVPSMAGCRARPAPAQFAPALPERPLGGYIALYGDGTLSVVAGGPTHLYRLVAGAWVVADTTGPFSTTQKWRFSQFNDDLIAVNGGVTNAQVAAGAAGTFHNLTGGPPTNLVTAISVGGVFVGYKGAAWANSAAGTDNNWTPDVQTQAADGTLYDYPGNITAASPFFRTQVVWKGASMYVLAYVGADTIWQNQLASNATGTWGQECVVQSPEAIYFIGNDDFWTTQGYAPTRVPNNVKEWFFRNIYRDIHNNPIYLQDTWSWYDPENAVVYWHFVSKAAPYPPYLPRGVDPGTADRYLAYNVRSQRWGTGYLNTVCVIGNTQPGLTNGMYFDTNFVLQSWTGAPTTMGLLTGFVGDQSKLSQLQRVRPGYADGLYPTSDQITPLATYVLGKPAIVGLPFIKGQDDWHNGRSYSRYHQVHLTTVGDTEVTGFAAELRIGGNR